jgi:putative acetyltransferase
MIVRRERPADHDAVRAVHRAAFGGPGGDDVVEARLVDELREDAGFLPHLSLVAQDGDDVVGHVIATRGRLEPLGIPVLGLGPLGVRPDHQRSGVGTALVHALVAAAEATDERLVALLGDPAYYGRFGFTAAAATVLKTPYDGPYQQALALTEKGRLPGGEAVYAQAFAELG